MGSFTSCLVYSAMLRYISVEELGEVSYKAKDDKGFVPSSVDFENTCPVPHALEYKCD